MNKKKFKWVGQMNTKSWPPTNKKTSLPIREGEIDNLSTLKQHE